MIAMMIAAQLSASCLVSVAGEAVESLGPRTVSMECPGDAPDAAGLQAAADAAAGRTDLALGLDTPARRREVGPFTYADTVRFARSEAGAWRAEPGQVLFEPATLIASRSVERGLTTIACTAALTVDEAGRPQDVRTACVSDAPEAATRDTEALFRRKVETMRLLPTSYRYCYVFDEQNTALVRVEGGAAAPAGAIDLTRLPELDCG